MTPVVSVDRLALRFSPQPWAFAQERRAEIEAHFAKMKAHRPQLWNGRILMMHRHKFENRALTGAYLETDFASFLAWRDWGFPDAAMVNCFAQAALRCADGAFLLGVMSEHTSNAGKIYFPSGTPDLNDIAGADVDLAASAVRELEEETGLTLDDVALDPGWDVVCAGPRIAAMKPMRSREPAERLRARILAYLAGQREPELSDILIVRGPQDLHPQMPDFVTAFLGHVWRGESSEGLPA